MNLRTSRMELPASQSEQTSVSTAFTFQRLSLAACIILAPLSITLYLLSWEGNGREPLIASAMAGPTGNILHLIDALAYNIDSGGSTAQLVALWKHFNGDAVMTTFLLIYIIGHLLSAVLIGFMLGRLRLVPAWAAWAFALTSPLTIILFPVHNIVFQDVLKYLICTLWIIGAIPAALAMLANKDLAHPALPPM